MGNRGKQSLEALMTLDAGAQVVQYPDAPYDLTDEEAEEWRAIVRSKLPDHFSRANYPMLAQLCRHIVDGRRIAQLIQVCVSAEEFNRKEYTSLLQMRATESSQIMKLSRAMRLTQQSSIDRLSIKNRSVSTAPNPWDREKR